MKKTAALKLYNRQLNLRSSKEQDADLVTKYNVSLFDFAYLLAIALNEEFLPPRPKKSYFGNWEELKKYKKTLERTKVELPAKPFFKRLFLLIDEYLNDIEIGLEATRMPSGSPVEKRTKLVLLWMHLLRKKKLISKNIPGTEGRKQYMDKANEVEKQFDWKDFYILLNWFSIKLENCSYLSYIKPNLNERNEREYSKSLLEKHYDKEDHTKHWHHAGNQIAHYITLQQHLKAGAKISSKQTQRLELINIKPYPIIQVNFNSDYIEIGELREDKVAMRRFSFIEEKRVPDFEEYVKNKPAKKNPIVIFHDGDVFTAENYAPPFHYYDESLLREWLEKIKSNSA